MATLEGPLAGQSHQHYRLGHQAEQQVGQSSSFSIAIASRQLGPSHLISELSQQVGTQVRTQHWEGQNLQKSQLQCPGQKRPASLEHQLQVSRTISEHMTKNHDAFLLDIALQLATICDC